MISKKIPLCGPWITDKEKEYVLDAVSGAWYEGAYKYVKKFEEKFREYIGVKYAISMPSCTSSIHLALAALNVGKGDEVIVPDITWIGSSAPIRYVGATEVFADIDETWCLSPSSLKECITKKTKAIIAVDLYGNIPKMKEISKIAKEYGIPLIEDAAEAIGSEYFGRRAGSLGDIGVFSFHGSKTLTTGEGGMVLTNDDKVYDRAMILRDHGRHPGDRPFWNREVAFKYKMSDLQAALGLAQLERIDELVGRKREIFNKYQKRLPKKYFSLNPDIEGVKNSYWLTTAIIEPSLGLNKERIIELSRENGMDIRPFFYPLSSLPAYSEGKEAAAAKKRNKESYRLHDYGINLPSGMNITDAQIASVCENLISIIENKK